MDNHKRVNNSVIDINSPINEAISALFFGLFFYYYYYFLHTIVQRYTLIL